MITKHLSGHMYHRSPYESDDDCGTCDGAKCEHCRPYWEVAGERYYKEEEAIKAEETLTENIANLVPMKLDDWRQPDEGDFYLKDDELWVQVYDNGYHDVKCNPDSPAYLEYWERAVERKHRYEICTCVDKDEEIEGDCSKFGCTDGSCYREMFAGKRKNKKWYM